MCNKETINFVKKIDNKKYKYRNIIYKKQKTRKCFQINIFFSTDIAISFCEKTFVSLKYNFFITLAWILKFKKKKIEKTELKIFTNFKI